MANLRYNSISNGQRIVVRLAAKEAGYPCLQVWERLEGFEDMLPLVWDLKQEELAREKERAAQRDAELELVDSWRESGIVKADETGNVATVNGAVCNLIRAKNGEPEIGGFRLYCDRKAHKVVAYVCWELVHSLDQYNQAVRAIRNVCWEVEQRNK